MNTWMKKTFTADGVTEWPPGPCLPELSKKFSPSGAVMLLLDTSGSMGARLAGGGSRMDQAKLGCQGFIEEAVTGGYQVGMLLWESQVQAFTPPHEDGAAASTLLASARPHGLTNVVPALRLAGQLLMDCDVTDRVIAIFGDGDLGVVDAATAEATRWAGHGIRIITLGLGDESARALSVIATEPDGGAAAASEQTLAQDIRSMASGLTRARRR